MTTTPSPIAPCDLATARRISDYLTTGFHHGTPEAQEAIARIIAGSHLTWLSDLERRAKDVGRQAAEEMIADDPMWACGTRSRGTEIAREARAACNKHTPEERAHYHAKGMELINHESASHKALEAVGDRSAARAAARARGETMYLHITKGSQIHLWYHQNDWCRGHSTPYQDAPCHRYVGDSSSTRIRNDLCYGHSCPGHLGDWICPMTGAQHCPGE